MFLAHACACVSAEGNLYAVGGYDSSSHLATVEKYEPQVSVGGRLGDSGASPLFRKAQPTVHGWEMKGDQRGQSIQGAILSTASQSCSGRAPCEVGTPGQPLAPLPIALRAAGVLSMP